MKKHKKNPDNPAPDFFIRNWFAAGAFFLVGLSVQAQKSEPQRRLDNRIQQLTSANLWQLKDSIPLKFDAYHTQGMVKIGDNYYMTAVEVSRWPQRYTEPDGKFDRDTGEGRGHLFKFSHSGELLADILLGEGTIYHPGGIDFDGRYIWVPVCEYRPFGKSIVYKVDITNHEVIRIFSIDDALGALTLDKASGTLTGVNWGSRNFYQWKINKKGRTNASPFQKVDNLSFYIDYQDCQSTGNGSFACGGIRNYRTLDGETSYALGGIDLISMRDLRPMRQIPIQLHSPAGRVMTQNPVWLEPTKTGLRAGFVPDDDLNAVLYVYETEIPGLR